VVELVLGKVKPTDQRPNGTVARIHGDKSAFDFGQLCDFPGVLGCANDPDDGTGPNSYLGRCLVRKPRLRGLQPITGNFDAFAILANGNDPFRCGLQDDCRKDIVIVGVLRQRIVDGFLKLLGVGGQVDESLRAAVNLAPLIVHDATRRAR
jgi:hypothetical protein